MSGLLCDGADMAGVAWQLCQMLCAVHYSKFNEQF